MHRRYLFGPVPGAFAGRELRGARQAGTCLAFGPGGGCDLDLDLGASVTWGDVGERLPAGWRPDFLVLDLSDLEVPSGLWSAPLPVLARAALWDNAWHRDRARLGRCDLILTDDEGARVMRREGLTTARAFPTDWDDRVGPDADGPEGIRDLDVVVVGSYPPQTSDRPGAGPWLTRVARLGERWRVRVATGLAGDETRALAGRARIVIVDGCPGESDRLVAGSSALGALVFFRAEGRAPEESGTGDRRDGVAFTDDNLEALLEEFLGDEDRRRASAESARERTLARGPWAIDDALQELVGREWEGLQESARRRAAVGAAAPASGPPHAGAPDGPLAALARIEAGAARGETDVARVRDLLSLLSQTDDGPLLAGPVETGYERFRREWERAAWSSAGRPLDEAQAKRVLLRWRLHALLADATGDLVHHYEAVLARPDLSATRAALGTALLRAGRPAEAADHLDAALAADPFDNRAALALFRALGESGDGPRRRLLARDRALLARAAPYAVPPEPWFTEGPGADAASPRARVSLCMIVKDEETNLPGCLASAADLVDEVVVVDTGSADRTREVAARAGARVFEFPWVDDFAAARNESLRHANGDWVFWLDADDRLDEEDRRKLRDLLAGLKDENVAYVMKCLCPSGPDEGGATVVDHVRLFRNHPQVRWRYRVHEQILPAVRRTGGQVRWSDVVIRHTGYQDPALRRRKLERDLRLLLAEAADQPDDPFTLFNLGSVYNELGRTAEALPLLRRSLGHSHPSDSIVRKLYALIVQGHRRLGEGPEALSACREGRALYPDDAELLFQEAILLRERGARAEAESRLLRLIQTREGDHFASVDPGLRGYKARHNLAVLYHEQNRPAEAEAQWRAALDERPDFQPARLGLGELCLRQGRWDDLEATARHLEAGPSGGVEASLLRARGHLARREFPAARLLVEALIARAPRALTPRVILSHVLLQEGRDPAAAEQALREILALDPGNPEARHNLAVLLR